MRSLEYNLYNFSHTQSKSCETDSNRVSSKNMCDLVLLMCSISEMHESLLEEGEVERAEFETLQDRGAETVNVNKIHGVSTEQLNSCLISL